MKVLSKEITDLIHQIQSLVIEIPEMTMYYQSNVYVLTVYSSLDKDNVYHKSIYVDSVLISEEETIEELKQIIKDLEAFKNESRSKSNSII